MRGSRPEVAVSTPPGCGARWHAAYSAVRANERVAAVLPGVAHANLRRGGGVAVISEVLRAAELRPVDSRRLVASLRAPASKRSAGIPELPRRSPSPPARRNPASPAPAARQDHETAAPHPATTSASNQRGNSPLRPSANAQGKRQAWVGSLLRACGPNFGRSD